MVNAATSCALAAISGVENVPSHMRDFLRGSRISETHFPQLRIRTPRYKGYLFKSLIRFTFFVVEEGEFEFEFKRLVNETIIFHSVAMM
ncbi:hypothetical protein Lal_00002225 [Lupinus albus]|nr:hypothetical protein Lal_00002225 [Lupinus albus]